MNDNNLSFDERCRASVADGVIAAIGRFISKNNVNLAPLKSGKLPIKVFSDKLLAEYKLKPGAPLFGDSFKGAVDSGVKAEEEALRAVFANKEYENFDRICRIIGHAACLDYLEKHREEVLNLILKIRGVK